MRVAWLCLMLLGCEPAPPNTTSFPEAWFGTWSGEVESTAASGSTSAFEFDLTIGPTDALDRFAWSVRYRNPSAGVEAEEAGVLFARDVTTGHYAIDEGNGSEVEARLMGETFTIWSTRLLGAGSTTLSVFRLDDLGTGRERIEYERFGAAAQPDGVAASLQPGHCLSSVEGYSWLVRGHRRATLRRR